MQGVIVDTIDPSFFQIDQSNPYLIGPVEQTLSQYRELNETRQTILVETPPEDILKFMDHHKKTIKTFSDAFKISFY